MNALLAFDTSTERTCIALELGGRVWQREGEGGAKASATFLPAVLELLDEAGIATRHLDAIAFGRGPGAFTGLRVACAVAQGLALGAGKPVLPIDTLLAIAEDGRDGAEGGRAWAVLDARMNEIYAAHYAHRSGCWSVVDAPQLLTAEALNRRWEQAPPESVCGNALAAFGDRLHTQGARLRPDAAPRAGALLALARQLWRAGGAVDPALALPCYVRDKVADTSAERAARSVSA